MAMGACPGQIPMPCVPPALMVTATMVRACRYRYCIFSDFRSVFNHSIGVRIIDGYQFTYLRWHRLSSSIWFHVCHHVYLLVSLQRNQNVKTHESF